MSRNMIGLIVAPWEFDVLKTSIGIEQNCSSNVYKMSIKCEYCCIAEILWFCIYSHRSPSSSNFHCNSLKLPGTKSLEAQLNEKRDYNSKFK